MQTNYIGSRLDEKKAKTILVLILLSLVLSLIMAPLRSGIVSIGSITGFYLSSIVGFIVYFLFTYYVFYRYGHTCKFILFSIITGISIFIVPVHIFNFEDTLISLPEYFIHILGIVSGYICYKLKNKYKIIFTILSIMCGLWLSISGYGLYLNKLSYGTFTGKVDEIIKSDLLFRDESGNIVDIKQFKNKYIVLDIWATWCGICYKKFPDVQQLYDKYKENPLIEIFAVHSYMEDELETTGTKIIRDRTFTFPCLSVRMDDSVLKDLGVDGYPNVLIFDKMGKLIFRGNIERAAKLIDKLIK